MSDTVERMLRPQGLFQNPQPKPFDWQQPWAAPAIGGQAAGGAPPPGLDSTMPHPPPASAVPNGGQYPPENQYQTVMLQPNGQPQSGAGYPGGAPVPPGGGYPPGQYGQGPYGQGQYGPNGGDQFAAGQFPPGPYDPSGAYGPGVQYGPDGLPLTGAKPPWKVGGLTVPRGPLIPAIVIGALVVIVVTAIILSSKTTPNQASSSGGSGATAGSTPTATSSTSGASNLAEKQAAVQLSGLLAQSGTDRADVNAAYSNVAACGKDLAKDAQIFNRAATNRRTLLTKLGQLPGRSVLSAAMIADLTGGWQASATVDSDLAKWASTAAGHCHKGNFKDPSLAAANPFDSQATNDKQAFAKLWNRLARKDGLSTYRVDQL
jgi:hypothetical protein